MFKFSLVSFGALSIFADLVHVVSRKWLIVQETDQNLGLRGKHLVYIVLLTVKCSISVLAHSVQVRFQRPCILKTADRRAEPTKIWASWVSVKVYRVLLTVRCSSSVWGHSVHIRFLYSTLNMYLGNG